jgi:hypothetical protein
MQKEITHAAQPRRTRGKHTPIRRCRIVNMGNWYLRVRGGNMTVRLGLGNEGKPGEVGKDSEGS